MFFFQLYGKEFRLNHQFGEYFLFFPSILFQVYDVYIYIYLYIHIKYICLYVCVCVSTCIHVGLSPSPVKNARIFTCFEIGNPERLSYASFASLTGKGDNPIPYIPWGSKDHGIKSLLEKTIILVGIYNQQVRDAVVKHELRFPCGKGMIINPIEGVYRLTIWIPY